MSYGQYNNNPYSQGPSAESGYGHDQGQQYGSGAQYGGGQYEMQPYGQEPQQQQYGQQYGQPNPYEQQGPYDQDHQKQPQESQASGAATLSQQDFLGRIGNLRNEIRSLTADIDNVAQLHQRALSSTDASGNANQLLDQAVAQTQIRNTSIKEEIKFLECDLSRTQDSTRASKQAQLNSIRETFKKELQSYMQMESDYQRRYKEQIARQYRIVNPDASEEEVREATNADWGNEGVFQTALKSNRVGQASNILGNVRARHSELQRIERTLTEIAQLFQEMATLVEQQEPIVDAAEQNAQQTVENIQKGNEQVEVANKHARNRRKLKWWCLLVVVLIITVIAVGVGVGVSVANN